MELWQSVLLGIVQGVTEWLPISSSGHLIIFQKILGLEQPLYYDIMLHIATVLVILLFFRKDILNLAKNMWDFKSKEFRQVLFILLGCIPTAIIGLVFKDYLEMAFGSIIIVGTALVLTGIVLDMSRKMHYVNEMKWWHAVLIGVAQGLAIVPGISRSGITIGLALMFGIKKRQATSFSFLMAMPVIIGAALLELPEISSVDIPWSIMAVGMGVTFIIGYASLSFLIKMIKNDLFHKFTWYCWILGFALLLYNLYISVL